MGFGGSKLTQVTRYQFWHPQINFSCFLIRHGPERFVLNVWIPRGSKRSRLFHSLYTLNKTVPESMCMSTSMILTRKLKISESVIRKWKIGIYRLVIHPVTYGLLNVSLDLCNLQKLTSETSEFNPNRQNMIRVIKWEFIVRTGSLDGLEIWFWFTWVHSNLWIDVMCVQELLCIRVCLICGQFLSVSPTLKNLV